MTPPYDGLPDKSKFENVCMIRDKLMMLTVRLAVHGSHRSGRIIGKISNPAVPKLLQSTIA